MSRLEDDQYFLLKNQVEALLGQEPDGMSEYALMQRLGWPAQADSPLTDLFRRHFLLFHVLYRLRREWRELGCGDIRIEALEIRLLPYVAGSPALAETDALEAYYLDFSHYAGTGEDEVARLLGQFATRYHARDELGEALAVFGLAQAPDWETVRARYKQLAHQSHPDRGGNTERFQRLNRAMQTLSRHYGKP